jgi:hypothetical protein
VDAVKSLHNELVLVKRENDMVAYLGYQFGWVTILGEREEEDIINEFFHLHMEIILVEDFLPLHLEFIRTEVPLSISITTPPMMTTDSLSQPMPSVVYNPLVTMHATSSRFEFGV